MSSPTDEHVMPNPEMNVDSRRAFFLARLATLCKEFRVMISPDHLECEASDVCFMEHGRTEDGYHFAADLGKVEEVLRLAVWPEVYPNDCH